MHGKIDDSSNLYHEQQYCYSKSIYIIEAVAKVRIHTYETISLIQFSNLKHNKYEFGHLLIYSMNIYNSTLYRCEKGVDRYYEITISS